ncbi:MAG: hypothetical protein CL759_01195 [Chloroflexi bacterium]|nr:hypothetical protein [Chloroflexota bacterium]
MNGLRWLVTRWPDRSSRDNWKSLEWVGVFVPVSFFLAYYFLKVGPARGFFHSVYGLALLVALIIIFSRLMFVAIDRLQRSIQSLSRQLSRQNVQLRALHETNLALSQERAYESVMQLVADLGRELFGNPKHPYTKALISAALPAHPNKQHEEIVLRGEVPSPINPPAGCSFHPRCPMVMDHCSTVIPERREISPEHRTSCHLYAETKAAGA